MTFCIGEKLVGAKQHVQHMGNGGNLRGDLGLPNTETDFSVRTRYRRLQHSLCVLLGLLSLFVSLSGRGSRISICKSPLPASHPGQQPRVFCTVEHILQPSEPSYDNTYVCQLRCDFPPITVDQHSIIQHGLHTWSFAVLKVALFNEVIFRCFSRYVQSKSTQGHKSHRQIFSVA